MIGIPWLWFKGFWLILSSVSYCVYMSRVHAALYSVQFV